MNAANDRVMDLESWRNRGDVPPKRLYGIIGWICCRSPLGINLMERFIPSVEKTQFSPFVLTRSVFRSNLN